MKFEKKLLATCVAMAVLSLTACNSDDDNSNKDKDTDTPTVADKTVLNIEAGTQIFADADNKAGIRVTRGATLNVQGTAEMPVIMSAADFDLSGGEITGGTDFTGRGDWGGLVVNGYAPVNGGDDSGDVPNESSSEAAPATETDVFYGGDNAADSSGSIEYLVIAESGVAFQPDAELQGLTLEGVGNGTTISYIQVLGSEDDGIEWFGGSVDVDHIVINGQDDDGLDFDDGYNGNVSHAIIRMGTNDGDTGIEADGGKASSDAYSTPTLSNITVLGNVGKGSKSTKGANFKENFSGKLYRSAFIADAASPVAGDFDGACIDVDTATAAANLKLVDVVCSSTANVASGDNITDFPAANNDMSNTTMTLDAATLAVNGAVAGDLDGTGFVKGDDTTTAVPSDYIGAVDPADATPWWDGWTVHIAETAESFGSLKNENFNPLTAEIGAGTIAPAAGITSAALAADEDLDFGCPEGTSQGQSTFVTLDGVEFPVCLISSHMTGDKAYTLTNDYVYVLTEYIKVGNGGVEDTAAE